MGEAEILDPVSAGTFKILKTTFRGTLGDFETCFSDISDLKPILGGISDVESYFWGALRVMSPEILRSISVWIREYVQIDIEKVST